MSDSSFQAFVGSWGLYNWSSELGSDAIHPDDESSFCELSPLGKVFHCVGQSDGYLELDFAGHVYRVTPKYYLEISQPEFLVGDQVRILVGSKSGLSATVVRMVWHHKRKQMMYFLRTDSNDLTRRYFAEDLSGF